MFKISYLYFEQNFWNQAKTFMMELFIISPNGTDQGLLKSEDEYLVGA